MIIGTIDEWENGVIRGWLYSMFPGVEPIVMIDGRHCDLLEWKRPRPDVGDALKVDKHVGFSFGYTHLEPNSTITLCAFYRGKLKVISARTSTTVGQNFSSLNTLFKMKAIADQPDSVAVVCWDGCHNPIGRAHVLYEAASRSRPTALFAFAFPEFGGQIWAPLAHSSSNIMLIPRHQRNTFYNMCKLLSIRFETIWLCKPRLPTFELGEILSADGSAVILDLDDNEVAFSRSEAATTKAYGLSSIGFSHLMTQKVVSRTVASVTLQRDFGGVLLRHARASEIVGASGVDATRTKIAFIGTVRDHKHLLFAARAVQIFRLKTSVPVSLHVLGSMPSQKYKQQLEDAGAIVGGVVPFDRLRETLLQYDVVLTGFPSESEQEDEIIKYQISSKIGDALAAGIPVLSPDTESVRDLAGVDGLYLFNVLNFEEQLTNALNHAGPIQLPEEFTFEGANRVFEMAMQTAREAPRAGEVFSTLSMRRNPAPPLSSGIRPKLVLIWKQYDAGLYGRRVDQIARSHRRRFPDHDVLVLQLMSETAAKEFEQAVDHVGSDAALILERIGSSREYDPLNEGVIYETIMYSVRQELTAKLLEVFSRRSVSPANATICVFQLLPDYGSIMNCLRNYVVVDDFVDNQLSWSNDSNHASVATQYFTAIANCRYGVFNSVETRDHFVNSYGSYLPSEAVLSVIPNWYEKPLTPMLEGVKQRHDVFNVIYSGNMNDRFDFELMEQLADALPAAQFHLFGSATRSLPQMRALLEKGNVIFEGPVAERQLAQRLHYMNLAIMPHLNDSVSRYMNPIKLKMYVAYGLHCVSTEVSGIDDVDNVTIVKSRDEFVAEVRRRGEMWASTDIPPLKSSVPEAGRPREALAYFEFLQRAWADHAKRAGLG